MVLHCGMANFVDIQERQSEVVFPTVYACYVCYAQNPLQYFSACLPDTSDIVTA